MEAEDKKIAEATCEEIEAVFGYLGHTPAKSAHEYKPQEGEATEEEIEEAFKNIKI